MGAFLAPILKGFAGSFFGVCGAESSESDAENKVKISPEPDNVGQCLPSSAGAWGPLFDLAPGSDRRMGPMGFTRPYQLGFGGATEWESVSEHGIVELCLPLGFLGRFGQGLLGAKMLEPLI